MNQLKEPQFRREPLEIPTSTVLPRNHFIDDTDLQGFAWSEDVGRKTRITLDALNVPSGYKKSKWLQEVADSHGVDRSTVYRYLEKYKEGKSQALRHTKSTKGRAIAWTPEALRRWQGLALKREHRHISLKSLYRILVNEANEKGWKTGGYSNACKKISEYVTPQLLALQKGGARELDNSLPPVLRSYADLQPFECLCGDQHKLDHWSLDPRTGEVIRLEIFIWQDLRTRLIYGVAVGGEHYSSHTVAQALRVGVYQWGLFRNVYTDHGRPELSRYIEGIVNDIKGYDISVRETISTPTDLSGTHHEELQCHIMLPGQHIKAVVKNAKAKIAEGLFREIERALRDQALLCGYVKRLSDPEERQAIDEKEIKRLAESGRLPTVQEVWEALLAACDWYNCEKPHRGLLREATCQPKPKSMTPMDCLEMCMREGWRPTWVPEDAIDLLFLPKESNPRTVDRGRILFHGARYEHPELIQLNGQKVRLRFDPQEPEYVLVFYKGEYLCRAETVEYSSMKNKDLATRKIKEKAHLRKKVVEQYREITKGIPDVRQFSEVPKFEKTAALIAGDRRKKAIENDELFRERTKEQLALEVAEIKTVSETVQHTPQNNNESAKRPAFFLNDLSHYKWILVQCVENREISKADQDFKKAHEAKMAPEVLEYWQRRVEFKEVGSC